MFKKSAIVLCSIMLMQVSSIAYSADSTITPSYNGEERGEFIGVDASIHTMFNTRLKAQEIQARAYIAEVKRRPESVLDMSCFSDSMSNFAELGKIFSDVKMNFTFNFSGNPLCSLISFNTDASLKTDLQTFFKVPGLDLPTGFEICSPELDIAGKLSDQLTGFLGASLGGNDLASGNNLLGCSINTSLKMDGSLAIEPMCAKVTLPDFSCGAINKLLYTAGNDVFEDLTGVDLSKGVNNGWVYLTVSDQGDISTGADIKMSDILAETDIPVLKDIAEIEDNVNEFIETYGNLSGGINLSAGISLSGGVSSNGSSDGLTSDGKIGIEAGQKSTMGTGKEFAYQLSSENNEAVQEKIKNDVVAIQEGPGGSVGTWKPLPTVNKTITLQDIINAVKDGGSSGGESTE